MATLEKIWVSPKHPRFFKTCMGKANVASILRAWHEPPHFLFFFILPNAELEPDCCHIIIIMHEQTTRMRKKIHFEACLAPLTLFNMMERFNFPSNYTQRYQLFNLLTKLYRTSKEFFALSLFSVKWGEKIGTKVELFFLLLIHEPRRRIFWRHNNKRSL